MRRENVWRNGGRPACYSWSMPDEPWKLLLCLVPCAFAALMNRDFLRSGLWGLASEPRLPPPAPSTLRIFLGVSDALHLVAGVSFYLVWAGRGLWDVSGARFAFGMETALSMVWPFLLLGSRSPRGELLASGFLMLAIMDMAAQSWPFSPLAAILQIPILAWTSYLALRNRRLRWTDRAGS